jgi:hypothetical protein
MMGYVTAMGTCFGCKRLFNFNPVRVPSVKTGGTKEPICADCVARVNPMRIKNGLPPIIPAADAYEACEEGELDG